MRTRTWAFRLLGVASVVQVLGEATHQVELAAVVKVALMPLLAWAWQVSVPEATIGALVWAALGAAWVGDISLLLAPAGPGDVSLLGVPKHPLWFLIGVMAFGVMHVCLITCFRRVDDREAPVDLPWPWMVPPLAFGALAAAVVVPAVMADPERADAALPVVVYAGLLTAMVIFALRRRRRVSLRSFQLTAVGACFFLFSDVMIGVSQLSTVAAMSQSGTVIMATYIAAMVLIVAGLAEQHRPAAVSAG